MLILGKYLKVDRIHHGGCWYFTEMNVRASYRGVCEPDKDHRRSHHGVRLVLPVQKLE